VWREADIAGVFFSPLVVYMAVALLIWLPLRWALERLGLTRWIWNTPLAEAGLYVCILGALVALL
jgi:hypothetical protein